MKKKPISKTNSLQGYDGVLSGMVELLARLAQDLSARFGRGFSRQNLQRFRRFYLSQPADKIRSTASSIFQTPSGKSLPLALANLAHAFPRRPRAEALRKVLRVGTPSLTQTNRAFASGYLRYAPFHRMPRGGTFEFQPNGDN